MPTKSLGPSKYAATQQTLLYLSRQATLDSRGPRITKAAGPAPASPLKTASAPRTRITLRGSRKLCTHCRFNPWCLVRADRCFIPVDIFSRHPTGGRGQKMKMDRKEIAINMEKPRSRVAKLLMVIQRHGFPLCFFTRPEILRNSPNPHSRLSHSVGRPWQPRVGEEAREGRGKRTRAPRRIPASCLARCGPSF